MSECWSEEEISAIVDGEADEATVAAFLHHARACSACRQTRDRLLALSWVLALEEDPEVPQAFEELIVSRAHALAPQPTNVVPLPMAPAGGAAATRAPRLRPPIQEGAAEASRKASWRPRSRRALALAAVVGLVAGASIFAGATRSEGPPAAATARQQMQLPLPLPAPPLSVVTGRRAGSPAHQTLRPRAVRLGASGRQSPPPAGRAAGPGSSTVALATLMNADGNLPMYPIVDEQARLVGWRLHRTAGATTSALPQGTLRLASY